MPDSFSHKTHKRRNFHNFLFTGPSCACTWSTAASSVLRGPSRSYLHRDFESIQGGSAGPRNCSCSSTCDQMSPPHPSLLLLNGEVIGDHEILSNIEYLIRRWQEWSDIESKKTPSRGFSHFVSATNRNYSHYGNIHEEITKDRLEVSFTCTTLEHFGTGPILCQASILNQHVVKILCVNIWTFLSCGPHDGELMCDCRLNV